AREDAQALRQALVDAVAAEREERTHDRDFSAELTFNGGGSPRSVLPIRLRVGDEHTAVFITLRGGEDDLDLYVEPGEELRSLGEADFTAASSSPDESILLQRAKGTLQSGV